MSENINRILQDWDKMSYEDKLIAFNRANQAWHQGKLPEETRASYYRRAKEESQELFNDFLFIDEVYVMDTAFPQRPSNRLLKAYDEKRINDPDLYRYIKVYKDERSSD